MYLSLRHNRILNTMKNKVRLDTHYFVQQLQTGLIRKKRDL